MKFVSSYSIEILFPPPGWSVVVFREAYVPGDCQDSHVTLFVQTFIQVCAKESHDPTDGYDVYGGERAKFVERYADGTKVVVLAPDVAVMSPRLCRRQPSWLPPADQPLRFERMITALCRVDRRDVPKHEPKKRVHATNPLLAAKRNSQ